MDKFDILATSRIDNKDNVLYLTCGDLPRKLYKEVDDILVNLHGKWNPSLEGHEFPYDPSNAITQVTSSRIAPAKNETAFHPTPESILDYAIDEPQWLNSPEIRLLEPSAGNGVAAKRMQTLYPQAHLDLVEYFWLNADVLRGAGFENIIEMDFLEYKTDELYDFAFLNPPFSIKGFPHCYVEHVQHAMSLLKEHRSLVCIVNPNFLTGNTEKLRAFRQWAFERLEWLEVSERGEFSTTKIETVVMKLHSDAIWNEEWENFPTRTISRASMVIDNTAKLYAKIQTFNEKKLSTFPKYFLGDVEEIARKEMGEYIYLNDEARDFLTIHYLTNAKQPAIIHHQSKLF